MDVFLCDFLIHQNSWDFLYGSTELSTWACVALVIVARVVL